MKVYNTSRYIWSFINKLSTFHSCVFSSFKVDFPPYSRFLSRSHESYKKKIERIEDLLSSLRQMHKQRTSQLSTYFPPEHRVSSHGIHPASLGGWPAAPIPAPRTVAWLLRWGCAGGSITWPRFVSRVQGNDSQGLVLEVDMARRLW